MKSGVPNGDRRLIRELMKLIKSKILLQVCFNSYIISLYIIHLNGNRASFGDQREQHWFLSWKYNKRSPSKVSTYFRKLEEKTTREEFRFNAMVFPHPRNQNKIVLESRFKLTDQYQCKAEVHIQSSVNQTDWHSVSYGFDYSVCQKKYLLLTQISSCILD